MDSLKDNIEQLTINSDTLNTDNHYAIDTSDHNFHDRSHEALFQHFRNLNFLERMEFLKGPIYSSNTNPATKEMVISFNLNYLNWSEAQRDKKDLERDKKDQDRERQINELVRTVVKLQDRVRKCSEVLEKGLQILKGNDD